MANRDINLKLDVVKNPERGLYELGRLPYTIGSA